MMLGKRVEVEYEGGTVNAYRSEPEQTHTGMVLVHGLGSSGYSERNLDLEERLFNSGIATMIMDLPGHGDSTPDISEATTKDYKNAVAAVVRNELELHPERKLGIYANSVGAYSALRTFEDKELAKNISYLILLSPIADLKKVMEREMEEVGFTAEEWESAGKAHFTTNDGSTLPLGFNFYQSVLEHPDVLKEVANYDGEALLIHGNRDAKADWTQVDNLYHMMPWATYKPFDADHEITTPNWDGRPNQDPVYLESLEVITNWLVGKTAPQRVRQPPKGGPGRFNLSRGRPLRYYEP